MGSVSRCRFIRESKAFGSENATRFRVSESSPVFDGHFEDEPILPGVAHIALALDVCAEQEPVVGRLCGLRDIRFLRPLFPGATVDVIVSEDSDPTAKKFELRSDGCSVTAGVLLFVGD